MEERRSSQHVQGRDDGATTPDGWPCFDKAEDLREIQGHQVRLRSPQRRQVGRTHDGRQEQGRRAEGVQHVSPRGNNTIGPATGKKQLSGAPTTTLARLLCESGLTSDGADVAPRKRASQGWRGGFAADARAPSLRRPRSRSVCAHIEDMALFIVGWTSSLRARGSSFQRARGARRASKAAAGAGVPRRRGAGASSAAG